MFSHFSEHHYVDAVLFQKLLQAAKNATQWDEVLMHIMAATGACAAMISLRDAKSCNVINDAELLQLYHSPRICGFAQEAVFHYISEFREKDSWARAQRFSYPHVPTFMSTVIDPKDTPNDPFFQWLNGLGIRDTLVCELGRMSGFWTALNLYFVEEGHIPNPKAKSYLETHLEALRDMWIVSQKVIHAEQTYRASIAHLGSPACVVNLMGNIVLHSDCFPQLVENGLVRITGHARKLEVSEGLSLIGKDIPSLPRFLPQSVPNRISSVACTRYDADPLYKGTGENHFLLTFHDRDSKYSVHRLTDTSCELLTPQEQKLLKFVKTGLSIRQAGEIIGIKRTRAFEVWVSIKEKTGILNAYQARIL